VILGQFIEAFAQLFHLLAQLYILVIIVRAVISWAGNIPYNTFVHILRKLTDPVFRLVHRALPFTIIGGIDISPVIILVFLYFVDSFLTRAMLSYAMQLQGGG
jgi:YggT family protein